MRTPYLITFGLLSMGIIAAPTSASSKPRSTTPLTIDEVAKIYAQITPSKAFKWERCLDDFYCANLDVPLTYGTPDSPRTSVPLIKLAATTEPYQGMLLYNPGGPGGSGIMALRDSAHDWANTTVGTNWDIVSWEPRGAGIFPLSANGCSNTTANQKRETPLLGDDRYEKLYASTVEKGAACKDSIGEADQIGPNMHTTAVVNDMISIVDAYIETPEGRKAPNSTLVNFWGESYGTIVGQYFASIYPERVGRFFLDGVVDPDDWASAFAIRSSQTTDAAFASFFMYCSIADPLQDSNGTDDNVGCPFHAGTTPQDVWNRFYQLTSQLDPKVAVGNNWSNSTSIEYGLTSLKLTIMGYLYDYVRFPKLANYLLAMEAIVDAQNITMEAISDLSESFGVDRPPGFQVRSRGRITIQDSGDDSLTAVSCSDAYPAARNATNEQILPYARLLESMSWVYSGDDAYQCVGWQIDPIGSYFSGPFGGRTQNPVLFGSSTRDPVTAIDNALKGLSLFPGSKLLTVEGTGHCTSSQSPNQCVQSKLYKFWQTGQLPSTDDHCLSENGPFGLQKGYQIEKDPDWRQLLLNLQTMGRDGWAAYGLEVKEDSMTL